jgi:ADP-ribosylglycohydrolase
MRVAPVGLVAGYQTPEEAFHLAAEAAALTHGHPSGYLSAGMMAAIVRLPVEGVQLKVRVNFPGYSEGNSPTQAPRGCF